ncbi:MAG: hypothetical protein WAX69_26980 [Victivallales bacterium]
MRISQVLRSANSLFPMILHYLKYSAIFVLGLFLHRKMGRGARAVIITERGDFYCKILYNGSYSVVKIIDSRFYSGTVIAVNSQVICRDKWHYRFLMRVKVWIYLHIPDY